MNGPDVYEHPGPAGFADSWKRVMTDPVGFYATMHETGGLYEPFAFLAVCAGINAVAHFVFGWWWAALGIFVWQLVGAFVGAAAMTLVAQHLFSGRAGFEATFRAVAYAAAPSVFSVVPFLGLLAGVWSAYLVVRGLERVHEMDATRAVLTVLIYLAALVLPFALYYPGYLHPR
jgi:hypothetical protein